MQQARPEKHRQEQNLQEKAALCGGAKTGMHAETRAVNHRGDAVLHHKESYDAADDTNSWDVLSIHTSQLHSCVPRIYHLTFYLQALSLFL